MPTRFPGGLNISRPNVFGGTLNQPYSMLFHTYENDFDNYVAGDWTVTETQAGATQAIIDGDGGLLRLGNSAADDDLNAIQLSKETFRFAVGKKLWFAARLTVSDATQSDFVAGLQITDTTPLAVTDGVYFIKADGSTTINLVVIKDSTSTTTAVGTATTSAIELAYYYNGKDAIEAYVNGVKVATSVTTNLPDDEDLTISFAIQNGEAAAKNLDIDYVYVSKER